MDLAPHRIAVAKIECAQEGLEGQPLDHQRAEDDSKRRQDDQVAIRKGCRKRQGRSERNDAPHPGPRNNQPAAHGRTQHRPRRMKAEPPVTPPDRRVEGHVPGGTNEDHSGEDRPGHRKVRPRSAASRVARIRRICRPMKMNARMFSANTTVSQTA